MPVGRSSGQNLLFILFYLYILILILFFVFPHPPKDPPIGEKRERSEQPLLTPKSTTKGKFFDEGPLGKNENKQTLKTGEPT